MSETLLYKKLAELEDRIHKLAKSHQQLQKKVQEKEQENATLQNMLAAKNEDLKSFQNQSKITKIVSSVAEDDQKATDIKNKINEYIKEIDKCIATLTEG